MDDRKSVLETTKPSDSLARLGERARHGRNVYVVVGAVLVVALAFLIVVIVENTTKSTSGLSLPRVERGVE